MTEFAGLLEVEPFTGTPPGAVGIRHCDICGCSGPDDTYWGRPWRTFYYDPLECLSVCEHCTEGYLKVKPPPNSGGEQ